MVDSKVESKHKLHEGIPLELPGVNAYTKYVRVGALGRGGFGKAQIQFAYFIICIIVLLNRN